MAVPIHHTKGRWNSWVPALRSQENAKWSQNSWILPLNTWSNGKMRSPLCRKKDNCWQGLITTKALSEGGQGRGSVQSTVILSAARNSTARLFCKGDILRSCFHLLAWDCIPSPSVNTELRGRKKILIRNTVSLCCRLLSMLTEQVHINRYPNTVGLNNT